MGFNNIDPYSRGPIDYDIPANNMPGTKYDENKLRYELITPESLKELAAVLTHGANKYAPNNWQKLDKDRIIGALFRHIEEWRAGEKNDVESGCSHLAHAMCNLMFLMWFDDNEKI